METRAADWGADQATAAQEPEAEVQLGAIVRVLRFNARG